MLKFQYLYTLSASARWLIIIGQKEQDHSVLSTIPFK